MGFVFTQYHLILNWRSLLYSFHGRLSSSLWLNVHIRSIYPSTNPDFQAQMFDVLLAALKIFFQIRCKYIFLQSTLYHGYAVYVRYTSVYFRILFAYATEANLINVALFGMIAKQWRDVNPGATSIFFQLCFNVSGLFFVLLKTSATETRANLRVNSNRDRTTAPVARCHPVRVVEW